MPVSPTNSTTHLADRTFTWRSEKTKKTNKKEKTEQYGYLLKKRDHCIVG
jgi:hypothetical protein